MQSRGKYKNIGTEKCITVLKLILIYTFYGIPNFQWRHSVHTNILQDHPV